jgi:hypothetical protein
MYKIFEVEGGYGYNIIDENDVVICTQPFNPYKSGFTPFTYAEAGSYGSISQHTFSKLVLVEPEVIILKKQSTFAVKLVSFVCTCTKRHTQEEIAVEGFTCDCDKLNALEWVIPSNFKVTLPDGSVEESLVHPVDGVYSFDFIPTLAGEHTIEVIVEEPFGTVIKTFTV